MTEMLPNPGLMGKIVKFWYKCVSCGRKTNEMNGYMTCPECGGDLIDNDQ